MPLPRLGDRFLRGGRLAVEPRPERGQVCPVQLFLGGDLRDGGRAAAGEPVAVLEGRCEVGRQGRFPVGTGVAGVEPADLTENLVRPIPALG